jgi:hypothetical protein
MANFIPKYEPLVPLLIQWIRDGSAVEREMAEKDLLDLTRLADRYLKLCADAAEAKAQPFVDDIMLRLLDKKGEA